jgi:cytochrome c
VIPRLVALLMIATLSAAPALATDVTFASGYRPTLTPELKARLAQADVAAGEKYFERRCSQCHDGEKTGGHAKGPFLWNWFGRKAASIPGFDFSPGLRRAGIAWDYATLDHYLADTERAVPGKSMNFGGMPDAALRAAVILHLRSLNDVPPPLP